MRSLRQIETFALIIESSDEYPSQHETYWSVEGMDRRVTCLEFGLVSVDHGIDPPRPCAQSCRLFRPPSACISMKKWSLDTKNFERLRGSWENTRVSLCEGSSTLNEVPSKPEAQISIELLQRRSEHNDGRLDTLEEIALHQQVRHQGDSLFDRSQSLHFSPAVL